MSKEPSKRHGTIADPDTHRDSVDYSKETESYSATGMEKIFDLLTDSICVVSREGTVVYANRALGRYLGCKTSEIIGKPLSQFLSVDGFSGIDDVMTSCDPGKSRTFTVRIASDWNKGSKPEMKMVCAETSGERYSYCIINSGITRDADHKLSEQRLKESEERLRLLIEGTDDVITLQDREGKFLYCNGPEKHGLPDGTLVGRTPFDVFSPDEASETMECLTYVFETGQSLTTEEDIVRDGKRFWFNVKRYPIRDETSNIVSVATISRNITHRKRMEDDIIKAQKLESVGTLAGGIAHDFNNILTVILGNMTLAKMSIPESNKAMKKLKDAEKATLRAKDLTQQLLTFARGGEPLKRIVFINRLVEESANFSLSGSNIRCEYSMADNLFPVEIDEGQMRQVIHNIVTNAKEAMPSGGVVTISTENIFLPSQNDLLLKSGQYVRINIQDRGPGIPEAHLQKIFDPYFTTKQMGSEKGTGLGLAICYSIVTNHHGHIQAESGSGEGSTLRIYLPAYQKGHIHDEKLDDSAPQEVQGRVLLMDDEEMVLEITAEILGTFGYEIKFATDGEGAIRLYKEARDSGKPFHAVILDLTIPGGMGGKDTIKKLIEIDPHVKGIASSGYSNDPVMAKFKKYGFSGAISKPFLIEDLHEALRSVMQESHK